MTTSHPYWRLSETAHSSIVSTSQRKAHRRKIRERSGNAVWSPVTSNKITEAVITDVCDHNYEQKLVNEYNAAQLGLYGPEEAKKHIDAYTEYLNTRAALKAQVDADCAELGIK